MSELVDLLNDLNQGNRIDYGDYSQLMFCVEQLERENAELKARIERMKCCGNCSEPCWNPPIVRKFECLGNNYSLWEMLK